jgi:hypothetical protein
MRALAEREQLELSQRKGELHRADDVSFCVSLMLRNARDRLRAIPSRLMHSLRGETDPLKINTAISNEIDGALTELSEAALSAMFAKESKQYLAGQLGCSEALVESVMSANGADED